MNMKDVVEQLKAHSPDALTGMSDAKVLKIVRALFEVVAAQINVTDEGKVAVPSLGKFSVRQVEKKAKEGETAAPGKQKRVIFTPVSAEKAMEMKTKKEAAKAAKKEAGGAKPAREPGKGGKGGKGGGKGGKGGKAARANAQ